MQLVREGFVALCMSSASFFNASRMLSSRTCLNEPARTVCYGAALPGDLHPFGVLLWTSHSDLRPSARDGSKTGEPS